MCCRHSPTPAHHPLSGTLQAASFHPPTVPLYREGNWGASAQKCPKSESLKTIFRPESLGLNCDQHIAAVGPRQSQGVGAAASPRPVRPCSVHGADSQQPALRGQDHPLRPLHRGGLLGSSYSVRWRSEHAARVSRWNLPDDTVGFVKAPFPGGNQATEKLSNLPRVAQLGGARALESDSEPLGQVVPWSFPFCRCGGALREVGHCPRPLLAPVTQVARPAPSMGWCFLALVFDFKGKQMLFTPLQDSMGTVL